MKYFLLITVLLFSEYMMAQSFEPGLWKSEDSFVINGIPLPTAKDEECLSKDQTKDAKATIVKELQRKGCSITSWTFLNQKLDATIKCKNNDMKATGKLSGPITSKSYELKGTAKGTIKDFLPAIADLKLTGRRVSGCIK